MSRPQMPVGPPHHHGQAAQLQAEADFDAAFSGLADMEQVADELRRRAAQAASAPGPRARALRAAARVVRHTATAQITPRSCRLGANLDMVLLLSFGLSCRQPVASPAQVDRHVSFRNGDELDEELFDHTAEWEASMARLSALQGWAGNTTTGRQPRRAREDLSHVPRWPGTAAAGAGDGTAREPQPRRETPYERLSRPSDPREQSNSARERPWTGAAMPPPPPLPLAPPRRESQRVRRPRDAEPRAGVADTAPRDAAAEAAERRVQASRSAYLSAAKRCGHCFQAQVALPFDSCCVDHHRSLASVHSLIRCPWTFPPSNGSRMHADIS